MKNIIHRLCAICVGICLWYVVSESRDDTLTLKIPLCFYPSESATTIEAPETVSVTLRGKRSELKQLEHKHLAAHVDVRSLDPKKPWISIEAKHLFLPDNVKMVNSMPSPVPVHIKNEIKNSLPQGV